MGALPVVEMAPGIAAARFPSEIGLALLLVVLLWSEQIGNNTNLCRMQGSQDVEVLLAGHGGEGER